MGAWGFVFLAYGIVWCAILIYWLTLKRRLRRAEDRTRAIARIAGVTKKCSNVGVSSSAVLIILAALSYIIYGGMQQAIVYFVTPSELKAKESTSADKFLRMGGMVVNGIAAKRRQESHLSLRLD